MKYYAVIDNIAYAKDRCQDPCQYKDYACGIDCHECDVPPGRGWLGRSA